MNMVREWRLDELIRRGGIKIKVEYDRQEKENGVPASGWKH